MTEDRLTVPEKMELKDLEAIVVSSQKEAEKHVGNAYKALGVIHGRKLYREHGTWQNYCKVVWKYTPQHANLLIQEGEVIEELEQLEKSESMDSVLPRTERVLRELAKVPTEELPQVRQKALEIAGGNAAHVTGKVIREAREVVGETEPSEPAPKPPKEWTDQRAKAKATAEALMRAVDDLQSIKRSTCHKPAILLTKQVIGQLEDWA